MVRLVFRPYTQIRRTICTSVSLRASTRVSPGFTLFRHRSPSFGSQQICYYSNLSQVKRSVDSASHVQIGRFLPQRQPSSQPLLSLRIMVCHPNTRIYVRLLGPCFKTGRLRQPFRTRSQIAHRITTPKSSIQPFAHAHSIVTMKTHRASTEAQGTKPQGGAPLLPQSKPR